VILRKGDVRRGQDGQREWLHYSDGGGLTQFGAYVETLPPGARSSDRHWHEKEDEFLYVLSGELTVVEDAGATVLHAGDAAAWAAGVPNAHHVANRSSAPCTYVIVGTRVTHDVCHYPDEGRVLFTEGEQWRLERVDGTLLKSGRCKSPPGRD
jgi:uncharacterized cupin superfamily protein